MRIRPYSIAYDTIALEASAAERSQYEFIPLPFEYASDTTTTISATSHGADGDGKSRDSGALQTKMKKYKYAMRGTHANPLEIMDSMVPPSIRYLRSVPIQPVIDMFTTLVESVSQDHMFQDRVSILRSGTCADNERTSSRPDVDEESLDSSRSIIAPDVMMDHSLQFSDELEKEAMAAKMLLDQYIPKLLKHTMAATMPLLPVPISASASVSNRSCMIQNGTSRDSNEDRNPFSNWNRRGGGSDRDQHLNLACDTLAPHLTQLRFEHDEDHTNTSTSTSISSTRARARAHRPNNCNWAKMQDWNKESAMNEYSMLLMNNVRVHSDSHHSDSYEYDYNNGYENVDVINRTPASNTSCFDNWLERRKDRWCFERMCRKSLAIVRENQCFKNTIMEDDVRHISEGLLNDHDFYIRIDPKPVHVPDLEEEVPLPSQKEDARTKNKIANNVPKFQVLSYLQFSGVGNHINRKHKVEDARDDSKKEEIIDWCIALHHRPESTIRNYMKSNSTMFQLDDCNKNKKKQRDEIFDIPIELPLSRIPSDPPIPFALDKSSGDTTRTSTLSTRTPSDLLPRPFLPLTLRNNFSLEAGNMVSKRHRNKDLECCGIQPIDTIIPTTNGLHLRSISAVANPYQVKGGLFLPHQKSINCQSVTSGNIRVSMINIVKETPFYEPRLMKISKRSRSTCSAAKDISSNDLMSLIQASKTHDCSDAMARLRRLNNSIVSTSCDSRPDHFFDSFRLYEGILAKSIDITGEFVHLSIKSRNLPNVTEPICQLDLVSMDLNRNNVDTCLIENLPEIPPEAPPEILPVPTKSGDAVCTPVDNIEIENRKIKKRQDREEARMEKKAKKRRKKEKKRARKAEHKSRKRKTREVNGSNDNESSREPKTVASTNDIPCIAVPSLHVGMTPMVMTRKIQTITEEVSVGTRPVMTDNDSKFESRVRRAHQTMVSTNISSKTDHSLEERRHLNIGRTLETGDCDVQNTKRTIRNLSPNLPSTWTGDQKLDAEEKRRENHPQPRMLDEFHTSWSARAPISEQKDKVPYQRVSKFQLPNQRQNDTTHNMHEAVVNEADIGTAICHYEGVTAPAHYEQSSYNLTTADHFDQRLQPVIDRIPTEKNKFHLLVAERFFEESSQAVAELSSGRWGEFTGSSQMKFDLHDCSLVDDCGVDIELPNRTAIKTLRPVPDRGSSFDCKNFTKEMVQLASSGRYRTIHVFIILGSSDATFHLDIITLLQNALVKQKGCPCQQTSFQYVATSLLSATIAQLAFANQQYSSTIDHSFESSMMKRAAFLLQLSPAMSAYGCLAFLREYGTLPFGKTILNAPKNPQNVKSKVFEKKSGIQLQACMSSIL